MLPVGRLEHDCITVAWTTCPYLCRCTSLRCYTGYNLVAVPIAAGALYPPLRFQVSGR